MDKSDLASLQFQNNMTDENTTFYNYSDEEDYSDHLCRKEVEVRDASIPLLFISVVVLSFICNTLVLVILALTGNLRSLTNIFSLNLALSNLLFTFGLLFHASYYWGWTFGESGCKAVKFLFYLGFYSGVLFLTLMTVQRYVAVVHPLSNRERSSFLVSSFIIWILSGMVAMLGSLHSKVMIEFDTLYCEYDTIEWKPAIAYFQNALFFIAFAIVCYCYGRMLLTVAKSSANKKHKTLRPTFFTVLLFFIGWAPFNIVMLLQSLAVYPFTNCEVSKGLDYAAYYACRILAVTHCFINTVVFLVFVEGRFHKSLGAVPRRFCLKIEVYD